MKRMFSGLWKILTYVLSFLLPFIIKAVFKWNVRILDLFFSGLILVLFWCVFILALEMSKHEKHQSAQSKLPRLKFDREVFFVLFKIAGKGPNNVGQVEIKRSELESKYLLYFSGKRRGDFNGLISKLAARKYVDTTSHVHPEVYCIITDEGFAFFDKYRHQKRWKEEVANIDRMKPGIVLHSEIS
jgi:hypothetical protein